MTKVFIPRHYRLSLFRTHLWLVEDWMVVDAWKKHLHDVALVVEGGYAGGLEVSGQVGHICLEFSES